MKKVLISILFLGFTSTYPMFKTGLGRIAAVARQTVSVVRNSSKYTGPLKISVNADTASYLETTENHNQENLNTTFPGVGFYKFINKILVPVTCYKYETNGVSSNNALIIPGLSQSSTKSLYFPLEYVQLPNESDGKPFSREVRLFDRIVELHFPGYYHNDFMALVEKEYRKSKNEKCRDIIIKYSQKGIQNDSDLSLEALIAQVSVQGKNFSDQALCKDSMTSLNYAVLNDHPIMNQENFSHAGITKIFEKILFNRDPFVAINFIDRMTGTEVSLFKENDHATFKPFGYLTNYTTCYVPVASINPQNYNNSIIAFYGKNKSINHASNFIPTILKKLFVDYNKTKFNFEKKIYADHMYRLIDAVKCVKENNSADELVEKIIAAGFHRR